MPRRRDWSNAPEQACRYCGGVHKATPDHFTRRAGTGIGVTTICHACDAKKREPLPEGTKRCGRCFAVRPVAEYHKHSVTKDGLRSYCIPCGLAEAADYRERYPEKVAERNAGRDKEVMAQRTREYRAADPERARRQWQEARERNRDTINARQRERYHADLEANREKARRHMREWYRRNPEATIRNSLAQRVKRRGDELRSIITPEFLNFLYRAQQGRCFYCGERIGRSYRKPHLEHYIPLSRGGDNHPTNLLMACQPCNSSKYNKMPWEWRPDRFPPPAAI